MKCSRWLFLAAGVLALVMSGPGLSQETQTKIKRVPIRPEDAQLIQGPQLYAAYCAVCPGNDGKGAGPAAAALSRPLPDLTQLASKEGGKFPSNRVRMAIVGDENVIAHGTKDMPVWGPIFRNTGPSRNLADLRVANLVDYVRTMQEK